MKRIISVWLASVFLLASGTVSATLFNFNYNALSVSPGSIVSSANMSIDGISLDITAYTVENNGHGAISDWSLLNGNGAGVYVSSSVSGNVGVKSAANDGTLLDGGHSAADLDEGLLFSFSEMVSLDYINFDYFTDNGGDDFNLTVDGVSVLHDINANNTASYSSLVSSVVNEFDEYTFTNIIGKDFFFWADSNSDSFRIDNIRISAVNSVPAPSAILLLMIGLLAFRINRSA